MGAISILRELRLFGSTGVDARDKEGLTKLYRASENGRDDVVRSLLAEGANVNRKCFYIGAKNSEGAKNGTTSLHAAANGDHLNIVKILLENGANIDVRDINGCTPLWLASMDGHADIACYLIEHGADVNLANGYESRGYSGGTPLATAVSLERTEVVKILLDNGALVNKATWRGDTPLGEALASGNSEIIEQLRRAGAEGVSTYQEEKRAFVAAYKKIRDTSEMTRMEIIEKIRRDGMSISNESAHIWASGADLEDGIIVL